MSLKEPLGVFTFTVYIDLSNSLRPPFLHISLITDGKAVFKEMQGGFKGNDE